MHSCSPRSVADVGPALVDLAAAVGVHRDRPVTAPAQQPPLGVRAFVPIWRRPWMTIGADTYGSSVLAALGVDNVLADLPERYPEVALGGRVGAASRRGARPVRAVPVRADGTSPSSSTVAPAVLVDGQDLFWWGVRTPDALARLHRQVGAVSPAG